MTQTSDPNHATSALNDARTGKRQRLEDLQASSRAIMRVFDVEILLRGLLLMLDLTSLLHFLEILAGNESWRGILTHEALWKEILMTRFAGNLPSVEHFDHDIEEETESDEEEEEDDDDEEEESEGNEDVENNDTEHMDASETIQVTSDMWNADVSSLKLFNAAGPTLKTFLLSAQQLAQFDARVQIIRGNIGDIEMVEGQRLDGLAFPTTLNLWNPHSGSARIVFQRAGQRLNDHVRTLNVRLRVGQAHVTPGFDAGVTKLIHVVGPNVFNSNCMKVLQRTYRSVLRCIQQENLSCVGVASISTGNMSLPVDKAAWYALCAIQRFLRSTPQWTATIAFVCLEADAYAAFTKSKAMLLTQFNAKKVRATPPRRQW